MKRQFALLLTSALLVFALTACGGDDKDASHDRGEQNTAGESIQDAGDNIADAGEDILDAGKDVLDPDDNKDDHSDQTDRDTADRRHRLHRGRRHQAERPCGRQLRPDAPERPGPRHGRIPERRGKRRQPRRRVTAPALGPSRRTARSQVHDSAAARAAALVCLAGGRGVLAFSAKYGRMEQQIPFAEKEPV